MKNAIIGFFLVFSSFLFVSCADDITGVQGVKGATGIPGKDATAQALVSLSRPAFRSYEDSPTQIVVMASSARPVSIWVENEGYTNTAPTFCDLIKTGRGGVDPGPAGENQIHYLYGVPSETASTFGLVASLNHPDQGPTHFSAWSYLGAFFVLPGPTVAHFVSLKGKYLQHESTNLVTNTQTTYQEHAVSVPPHAQFVIGLAQVKPLGSHGTASFAAVNKDIDIDEPEVGLPDAPLASVVLTTDSTIMYHVSQQAIIPLYKPNKIYIKNTSGVTARFYTQGWIEDPLVWK